jgi:hypothetical protein
MAQQYGCHGNCQAKDKNNDESETQHPQILIHAKNSKMSTIRGTTLVVILKTLLKLEGIIFLCTYIHTAIQNEIYHGKFKN